MSIDTEYEGGAAPSRPGLGRAGKRIRGKAVRKVATKTATKKVAFLIGAKVAFWVAVVMVLLFLVIVAAGGSEEDTDTTFDAPAAGVNDGVFDAGYIISDEVFFNAKSMTAQQIQAFLDERGADCTAVTCLRNMRITTTDKPATELCAAYSGGTDETFAVVLSKMTTACGINPQVLLATVQKESGGVTRVNPEPGWDAAIFGFACPDSGPGGSANCSAEFAGVVPQTWGLVQQFQKYTKNPGNYNYKIGENQILYNVVEDCQERKTVNIRNQATANLYIYTPYTPTDESLAAYPAAVTGDGASCASYGNRNFWYSFRDFFGSTGAGPSASGGTGSATGPGTVLVNGPKITIPAGQEITGIITAPNDTVAKALTAGLLYLGTRYSWGGGNQTGPTVGVTGGCTAACYEFDDPNQVGFDCSGLMMYLWGQVGINLPRYSQAQLAAGPRIPYDQRLPGDLLGWSTHVAVYIGEFDGQAYMLEAPQSGSKVRLSPVRSGHYDAVTRVWS